MPSVSEGYSTEAHGNIDKAIRDTFSDPEFLEDASRILLLTRRAHIWEDVLIESNINIMRFFFRIASVGIVGLFMWTLFKNPSRFVGDVPMWIFFLLTVVLTVLESKWSAKKIRNAKEELDLLIKERPEYWEPLVERIKQIVINHGNAEHFFGSGSRQVIRLTDT